MTQQAVRDSLAVTARHYANGGLAGSVDYHFTNDPKHRRAYPLIRVHRSGQVELYGVARNSEWAVLIQAMRQDMADAMSGEGTQRGTSRKVNV